MSVSVSGDFLCLEGYSYWLSCASHPTPQKNPVPWGVTLVETGPGDGTSEDEGLPEGGGLARRGRRPHRKGPRGPRHTGRTPCADEGGPALGTWKASKAAWRGAPPRLGRARQGPPAGLGEAWTQQRLDPRLPPAACGTLTPCYFSPSPSPLRYGPACVLPGQGRPACCPRNLPIGSLLSASSFNRAQRHGSLKDKRTNNRAS